MLNTELNSERQGGSKKVKDMKLETHAAFMRELVRLAMVYGRWSSNDHLQYVCKNLSTVDVVSSDDILRQAAHLCLAADKMEKPK